MILVLNLYTKDPRWYINVSFVYDDIQASLLHSWFVCILLCLGRLVLKKINSSFMSHIHSCEPKHSASTDLIPRHPIREHQPTNQLAETLKYSNSFMGSRSWHCKSDSFICAIPNTNQLINCSLIQTFHVSRKAIGTIFV
jgi:hypothetical protein